MDAERIERCLAKARECELLAQRTHDRLTAYTYRDLARTWREMADQIEELAGQLEKLRE